MVNRGATTIIDIEKPLYTTPQGRAVMRWQWVECTSLDRFRQTQKSLAAERTTQRSELIEQDPKTPDVSLLVVCTVVHELGAQVEWCTIECLEKHRVFRHLSAHAQIAQFGCCTPASEHNIQCLKITVNNTILVQMLNSQAYLME